MAGDTFARQGAESVDGYSETYICAQGFAGVYRLALKRVSGKVTAGKVTIDIVTNLGTENGKAHPQAIGNR